jgi:acyl-CoA-binding protein
MTGAQFQEAVKASRQLKAKPSNDELLEVRTYSHASSAKHTLQIPPIKETWKKTRVREHVWTATLGTLKAVYCMRPLLLDSAVDEQDRSHENKTGRRKR